MSAFLGPIHLRMYQRILHQDVFGQSLLNLAQKKEWDISFIESVKYPAAENKLLEDIIDQENIHGWLSNAVENCERRFAKIVCNLLKDDDSRLADAKCLMQTLGTKYKAEKNLTAEDAYTLIHDALLDGMPCDFPFETILSTPDEVKWRISHCPHSPYWEAENCNVDVYYSLRDSWVKGFLSDTSLVQKREGDIHSIGKEE